jgi:ubiquinone/menaquinone biosynthesis C-methylase UbiE
MTVEYAIEKTLDFATAWLEYREKSEAAHEIVLYPRLLQKLGSIKNQVVMDAGCGNGIFINELLKQQPSHIIGFDINEFLINQAQLQFPAQVKLFQHDLAELLPLDNNVCDKLVNSCVLMHLDNPALIFAASEFARVVRPGGEVVVSVVHHKWASRMYDLQEDDNGTLVTRKCKSNVEFVEYYRSGDFLESIFQSVGFQIMEREDVIIPHNSQLPHRYNDNAGFPLFEVFHLLCCN